jgi:hypothetical protein
MSRSLVVEFFFAEPVAAAAVIGCGCPWSCCGIAPILAGKFPVAAAAAAAAFIFIIAAALFHICDIKNGFPK